MRGLLLIPVLVGMTSSVYAGSFDEPLAVQYRWIGGLTFTSKTAACLYDMVGDHAIARFRPSGLGDNGPNSVLSLFYTRFAEGFRVAGPFTTAIKVALGQSIGAGLGTYPAATYVRFLTQTPAVITTTTNIITATGQIFGYDYTSGCNVTFSVILQPDKQ